MKTLAFAIAILAALLLCLVRRRGARIDDSAAKLRDWQRGECDFDLNRDPVGKEDRL
jgi:hypothetical protein